MKRLAILVTIVSHACTAAFGQLTIESCQEMARDNFPLIKQYGLIEKTAGYNISNANKGYLPQFSLSANAMYATIKSDILNSLVYDDNINSKVAYATLGVNQTIWAGGAIKSQKQMVEASTAVEAQNTEVQVYALRNRIDQLFFGALLLNEQLAQNESLQKELQNNYDRVKAYIDGGVANQSDLDEIRVEQLKNTQQRDELKTTCNAYRQMLAAMTGDTAIISQTLMKPDMQMCDATVINRPELKLYEAQGSYYDSQISYYKSNNLPKIGFSATAGLAKIGNDNFNSPSLGLFTAGIGLSWNFGNLYTYKNNIQKLQINKQSVSVQKETFLYNNKLETTQQLNNIAKLKEQIKSDDEIISLRTGIRETAGAKVESGALSISDLLTKLNEEDLAKQNKILHETQLLMAIYKLKDLKNN